MTQARSKHAVDIIHRAPDDFIEDVFGKGRDEKYFGSGKPSAGGVAIPIDFLSGNQGRALHGLRGVILTGTTEGIFRSNDIRLGWKMTSQGLTGP